MGIASDRGASSLNVTGIAGMTDGTAVPAAADFMKAFKEGFITVDDIRKRQQGAMEQGSDLTVNLAANDLRRRQLEVEHEVFPVNAERKRIEAGTQQIAAKILLEQAKEAVNLSKAETERIKLGSLNATAIQPHLLEADRNNARVLAAKTATAVLNIGQDSKTEQNKSELANKASVFDLQQFDPQARTKANADAILFGQSEEALETANYDRETNGQYSAALAWWGKNRDGIAIPTAWNEVTGKMEPDMAEMRRVAEDDRAITLQEKARTQDRLDRALDIKEGAAGDGNHAAKATEFQRKLRLYAPQMYDSQNVVDDLVKKVGFKPEEAGAQIFASLPAYVEGSSGVQWIKDMMKIPAGATRRYVNARNRWIEGYLRARSGAVISPQEYVEAAQAFFPVLGDTEENIKIKEQSRLNSHTAMYQEAYDEPFDPENPFVHGTRRHPPAAAAVPGGFSPAPGAGAEAAAAAPPGGTPATPAKPVLTVAPGGPTVAGEYPTVHTDAEVDALPPTMKFFRDKSGQAYFNPRYRGP